MTEYTVIAFATGVVGFFGLSWAVSAFKSSLRRKEENTKQKVAAPKVKPPPLKVQFVAPVKSLDELVTRSMRTFLAQCDSEWPVNFRLQVRAESVASKAIMVKMGYRLGNGTPYVVNEVAQRIADYQVEGVPSNLVPSNLLERALSARDLQLWSFHEQQMPSTLRAELHVEVANTVSVVSDPPVDDVDLLAARLETDIDLRQKLLERNIHVFVKNPNGDAE